ncbi:MAG: rhodanese-like domain-containing protein [Betaproteobacteria bacterium]|nr:MAG: rhodanese-like domain-containing protein [Betaproteobacteria bacterium]
MDFVQNNLLLIAVAFVSGAMLIWPLVRRGTGGPWVSTLQATHMINREDALVLDVRLPADYAKGHILGAKNAPLAELERRLPEFAKFKARPVIVLCESGNRSSNAIGLLRRNGFDKVFNLAGGLAAWQQAGLPVSK